MGVTRKGRISIYKWHKHCWANSGGRQASVDHNARQKWHSTAHVSVCRKAGNAKGNAGIMALLKCSKFQVTLARSQY